jgi:hypothetical protein
MNKIICNMAGIIFIFMLTSCADQIVSECNDAVLAGLQSKLSSIQQYVFTPYCALAGCHGAVAPQHELNLSSGSSYSGLVDVTSHEDGVLKRVAAGNSAQSWLMKKLKGDGTTLMPPTGQLSQAMIDTVAAWIDAGALNN